MGYVLLFMGVVAFFWAAILMAFGGALVARWREPVLRHPVLVIESDDWGAGPLEQADALRRLTALLKRVHDCSGRPALMTLGVVLEVPDGPRVAASGLREYHALPLTDARFDGVRAAIHEGIAAGVFAPQLHGQSHYWPPALLAAAQNVVAVRAWLTANDPAATESLPPSLQSRWVDASTLPSRLLDPAVIRLAVAQEAAAYEALFGSAPRVAVATTFVWNDAVEAGWAAAGIEAIVTPAHRATCRDAQGQPGCVDVTILAGERASAGPTYLVRDVYFEPVLGHAPERLAQGLSARSRQGRACLVETHRFNFLQAREASLAALGAALNVARAACPDVRFASPLEIARAMRARDPAWIETRLAPRIAAWRARLEEIPHFRRIARLSGLALPLALLGGRA